MDKTQKRLLFNLLCNIAFSIYYIVYGLISQSWWLLTIGVYYVILSIARFAILRSKREVGRASRFISVMLMLLALPLAGTVVLAVLSDRGHVYHMILMIAMATYSFFQITLAIINFINSRKSNSVRLMTLRNVSLASASVSIFSLQRSMLASFSGVNGEALTQLEVQILNAFTGIAVCVVVFLLGLSLLKANVSPVNADQQ